MPPNGSRRGDRLHDVHSAVPLGGRRSCRGARVRRCRAVEPRAGDRRDCRGRRQLRGAGVCDRPRPEGQQHSQPAARRRSDHRASAAPLCLDSRRSGRCGIRDHRLQRRLAADPQCGGGGGYARQRQARLQRPGMDFRRPGRCHARQPSPARRTTPRRRNCRQPARRGQRLGAGFVRGDAHPCLSGRFRRGHPAIAADPERTREAAPRLVGATVLEPADDCDRGE
jgi:hypothetical protein